jgi:hypothetical protein
MFKISVTVTTVIFMGFEKKGKIKFISKGLFEKSMRKLPE